MLLSSHGNHREQSIPELGVPFIPPSAGLMDHLGVP